MQLSQLQHKRPGSFIKAAEWNALLDALKAESSTKLPATFHRKWVHVYNGTGADIAPFSVFGITDDAPGSGSDADIPDDPPLKTVAQIGPLGGGSMFLPLTNGSEIISDGSYGVAHVVSADEPTRLRRASTNVPRLGYPCGAAMDAMEVEDNRIGFICVGESPGIDDAGDCVDVIRDIGGSIIGEVTQKISPINGDILGQGLITVKLRSYPFYPTLASANINNIIVYSVAENAFEVGDIVKADPVAGVGYVVDCCIEGSSSDEEEESESATSQGDCNPCEDGLAPECYRVDISGAVPFPGQPNCLKAWNQSWWLKRATPVSVEFECMWRRAGYANENWPCGEELPLWLCGMTMSIKQHEGLEKARVLLSIFERRAGFGTQVAYFQGIFDYDSPAGFNCLFTSPKTLAFSNMENDPLRTDFSGATVTFVKDVCRDVEEPNEEDSSDTPSGSEEPDPPEEPMTCERASDETPQALVVIPTGVITNNGCNAATINGTEFEIPAAYPGAPGCEWRIDDIEDGPCGLTSIYSEIQTTEWILTFEFGVAIVVFSATVSGIFDLTAGRNFTFQSESGAPADFTSAVIELFGGE